MTTDTSAEALERELFVLWLESRPPFRTKTSVDAAWEGWKANTAVAAMLAAEKRRAREGVTEESKVRAWNEYRSSAVAKITTIHELDVCWAFEGGWDAAIEAVWPDGRDAKDAARYRWLRSCGAAAEELAICTDYGWVTGSDFDETIDAAMKDTDND